MIAVGAKNILQKRLKEPTNTVQQIITKNVLSNDFLKPYKKQQKFIVFCCKTAVFTFD